MEKPNDDKELVILARRIKLSIMNKTNLIGLTLTEMENLAVELGDKKYKGRQLFKWIYRQQVDSFDLMTDLSLGLRNRREEKYIIKGLELEKSSLSDDGTEKLLFKLDDKKLIESVIIPEGDKKTICVSTQVGCPIKCSFCATGMMGFTRNLTIGEIIGQLMFVRGRDGDDSIDNIVFMGMGEPLLNYNNLIESIKMISSELGLSISAKKITVSTVGIISKIYKLADSGLKVNLAISLHVADERKRRRLIKTAKSSSLDSLMEAAAYFAKKRKRRVTFEYILFKGFNDSKDDALALSRLIEGIPCKINILAYNPIDDSRFKRPTVEEVDSFAKFLYPRAPAVTVRKSRGADINAACGQLASMQKKVR
jgi:23S rRNA (adenine2503-C2)-methyltransferase